MNLIIDGQLLQTSAWYRGMGKYTLQVMRGLSEIAKKDLHISVILNGNLNLDADRLATIKALCPNISQILIELPIPVKSDESERAEEYKKQLESLIETNFSNGDNYYLMTSLFTFDYFAEFPENCHKSLLFYDLTPFLFWKDLGGYFPPELYFARFQSILAADNIFSISETTRKDVISCLGIDPNKITNINGGFTKVSELSNKPKTFNVPNNYVLFPTGDLPHKNNDLAVEGFEKYCKISKEDIKLLITSSFSDVSKLQLQTISNNIIFTDNVSDEELEWLYENSQAVLFASNYEGLGMPILDAVANNKPIIASKISVFKEMSTRAFYFFDPKNSNSLSLSIKEALNHNTFNLRAEYYRPILDKYTWSNTCESMVRVLNNTNASSATETGKEIASKPRIAVACLHPGIAQQAGRIAESLHLSLSKMFEIDYFFDANGYHYTEMERPTFLDFVTSAKTFDITKLSLYTYVDYRCILYLLDNTSIPSRVAQKAVVLPGIAVCSFESNINENKDFQELIVQNQIKNHQLAGSTYKEHEALSKKISSEVEQMRENPNIKSEYIRRGGTKQKITRKLLNYEE